MNIDIFILARSASTRLPKKHLKEVNDIPIIENLVNRMKQAKLVRKIVVCTTNLASDDKLVEMLDEKHIEYFRGNDKDIIQRLYDAAQFYNTDIIIDVSGDKIYTDVDFVDKVSEILLSKNVDFVRGNNSENIFDPNAHFIHGVIPGGFKTTALEKICKLKKISNTENGYTELFTTNHVIKKKYIIPDIDFNFINDIKIDLDYTEDLELARRIFSELGNDFHMNDLLMYFSKNPDQVNQTKKIIKKWRKNYAGKTLEFRKKI